MARQAAGAAVLRYGDTMVLAAVTVSPNVSALPFFPLTVEYREKTYAAGKIPGGFLKREGRPSDKEILAKSPQYAALNEVLKQQHPYPQIEQYGYVANTILAANAGAVWSRQVKPKEGMTKAKEEAIQYLKEQGVLK